MKNSILILLIILIFIHFDYGQYLPKPILDTSTFKNFETLIYSNYIISDNGKYVYFDRERPIVENNFSPTIAIVKAINGNWVTEIELDGKATFTSDSKHLIFKKYSNKVLVSLKLGTNRIDSFPHVRDEQIINDYGSMISFIEKENNLVILDLNNNNNKMIFENCLYYKLSNNGKVIVFVARENGLTYLYKVDINSEKKNLIWKGNNNIDNLIIDSNGDHIAFNINSNIFLYNIHIDRKITTFAFPNDKEFLGLEKPNLERFSNSGKLLFFNMTQPVPSEASSANQVDIFGYLDGIFNLNPSLTPTQYTCAYNSITHKFKRIEHENERIKKISNDETKIFIESTEGPAAQFYWNKKSHHKDYVLFIDTEDTVRIQTDNIDNNMSPSGDFVIGTFQTWGNIFSTDISKRVVYNLTSELPIPEFNNFLEKPLTQRSRGLFFKNFMTTDSNIIVSDYYDLWMINCRNSFAPINLTNVFGRNHHIRFRMIPDNLSCKNKEEIIISSFNEENKETGFYKIKIGIKKDPELLSKGNYSYDDIKKAKNANIWVVKRMSATNSLNYFWTNDFKTFQPLSNIEPEKKYNWFTTELIKYKTKTGETYDAMLYKPENFDSTKKYPVLFNFYEQESFKLNHFLLPGYTSIYYFNIPLMLNHGYLVCVPDIHFKIGETANSIVNCVEGAADYLSHLPYVDSTRYGASGGSFGGYGVNCLAALSHRFSALVSISGISDLVSAYGNIPGLREEIYENGQVRMGVSLAKDPERYLYNSPIAYTRNVTTPLLIVITKIDGNVNIQQGIEFFISLRRWGKKAWLIRYLSENSTHGVSDIDDQRDLYVRMTQFFDYYLKGKPIPKWMTESISTQQMHMRSSTEYDSVIHNPPSGLPIDSI